MGINIIDLDALDKGERLYGSLSNRLMERGQQVQPEVGMGATVTMYTDRKAYTVIEVRHNGKMVVVRRDTATRTDTNGMSDCQSYRYEPNENGRIETFTLRKNGRWLQVGESMRSYGCALIIGTRDEYHDYSF